MPPRFGGSLTGPTLATATTATIRRKLIIVPARIAYSARRITLHLPQYWPWESGSDHPLLPHLRTTSSSTQLTRSR